MKDIRVWQLDSPASLVAMVCMQCEGDPSVPMAAAKKVLANHGATISAFSLDVSEDLC